jgi:hypothetical protein
MGDDSILLWLSVEIALGYWVAVMVGMMGALQVVAVGAKRTDLQWLPVRIALPVGILLLGGAVGWFYTTFYRLIFVPGPAGLELMVLFGSGTAVAVWATRLLAWTIRQRRTTEARRDGDTEGTA